MRERSSGRRGGVARIDKCEEGRDVRMRKVVEMDLRKVVGTDLREEYLIKSR